jgi:peptide deformylase
MTLPLYDIVLFPSEILRSQTKTVKQINVETTEIIERMFNTMYEAQGIGLAAPQVGILQKIVVIDISNNRNEKIALINPKIIDSNGSVKSEEGCLSIPGYRETILRSDTVTVEYTTQDNELKTFSASGILAFCLQHEIDHLNGILFVDRLSTLKKQFFKRWQNKNL